MHYLLVVAVGIIWGITNPFMERAAQRKNKKESLDLSTSRVVRALTDIAFLLPFLINQLGSVLHVYALSFVNITSANLVANSVNVAITFMTENILHHRIPSLNSILGLVCILFGVALSFIP